MDAQWDPKEKTFLITGGASGLGALYSEWFLKEGAKNVAILDAAEDKGRALAKILNTTYPEKVVFYKCDVGDDTQTTDVFEKVLKKLGRIDVIINNAGIMNDSTAMWKKTIDVNLQGLVSLTLKGVKHMRKDEGGSGGTIINVSSAVAFLKFPFVPVYSGSKAAVLQFSQCIAMDPIHEQTGVRILTMCLGATNTLILEDLKYKAWDDNSGKALQDYVATSTVKQMPESAADAVVKMFKEGVNGSVWLSVLDRPGKDISSTLDAAYKTFEALLL